MPSVDERVVEMKFNNASFMQKSTATIGVLQKLRERLNFKGAQKGMQEIDRAQKNMRFEGMAAGIESINQKFSALGAVAFSVINNIVNRAMAAGIQIAKAFSFGPVMDGFQEYQTNMNSIQTILANTQSKGSTLDDVNAALQELNEYADLTIYNFAQMARNIGTFTAAGVDLETSTGAIKGIANIAAISGSDANQASVAMYQLSQALAAGQVKLMDWNSVVNAGMGGEVFKSALFETGKALGKLGGVPMDQTFKEWEAAGNSFRESLQDEWLTAEVLTTTLQAFTGDLNEAQLIQLGYTEKQAKEMLKLGKLGVAAATEVKTITQLVDTVKEAIGTGWADSFRIVVGDFEEAKTLLTNINDVVSGVIGKWAESRNLLLTQWKFLGGRDLLINGMRENFLKLGKVLETIGLAFREIFPKRDAWQLIDLTQRFVDFVNRLIPGQESLGRIRDLFRGIFSVLAIGWEVVKSIASAFSDLFGAFSSKVGDNVLGFFSRLAMKIAFAKRELVDGGGIKKTIDGWFAPLISFINNFENTKAFEIFQNLKSAVISLGEALGNFFGMTSGAEDSAGRLGERWGFLTGFGEKLGNALGWLADKFAALTGEVKDMFGKLAEGLKTADFNPFMDALNVGIIGGIAYAFKNLFENFTLEGNGFVERIREIGDGIMETFGALQREMQSRTLLNIAIAIGALAASLLVLSLIDSVALAKALTATAVGMGQLVLAMSMLLKLGMGPKGALSVNAIGTALIMLGAALLIFAVAVKVLSTMDIKEMLQGILGVTLLLAGLTIALKNMPAKTRLIATGIAIGIIAAGMLLLSASVKVLAGIEVEQMLQGILGVTLLLTALTIAMKNMPAKTRLIATGLGIMGVAVALLILTLPVKILANMDIKAMLRGLLGIALMLAALALAMNAMPSNMLGIGAGLLAVSIGLLIITKAISDIGNMDLKTLVYGLGGIAIALAILVLAANAMSGAIAGALAIVVMSGALLVLGVALKTIASLGWGGLLISLVGLAAVLVILAVAANLLAPLIPAMFALGLAMMSFGIGLALVGASVFLVGAGLLMIVKAFRELMELSLNNFDRLNQMFAWLLEKMAEFGEALFDLVMELGKRFIAELPGIFRGIGEAIRVLLDEINKNLPLFFDTIDTFLTELLQLIRDRGPDFIDTGFFMLKEFLRGIDENIEDIANKAVDIILKFNETLQDRMGDLVQAGANTIISFLEGLATQVPLIALAAMVLLVTIIDSMSDNIQMIIDAGGDLVIKLIEGIGQKTQEVIDAGTKLVVDLLTGLNASANTILTAGVNLMIDFMTGLAKNVTLLVKTGTSLALSVLRGIADSSMMFIRGAAKIILDFLHGLADAIRTYSGEFRAAGRDIASAIASGITGGLSDRVPDVLGSVRGLASGAKNAFMGAIGANSPSKDFIRMAGYIVDGLVIGLNDHGRASKSSANMADGVKNAFMSTIGNISSEIEGMDEFNPTITPVLDLTNVEKKAGDIARLMSTSDLGVSAALTQAEAISINKLPDYDDSRSNSSGPTEIKFEQNIHAPKALRTGDIYRQTKSQITLAKEKLGK